MCLFIKIISISDRPPGGSQDGRLSPGLTDVLPMPSVLVITFGAGTPHTCIAWGPGGL